MARNTSRAPHLEDDAVEASDVRMWKSQQLTNRTSGLLHANVLRPNSRYVEVGVPVNVAV
jgi:hypothetical protein